MHTHNFCVHTFPDTFTMHMRTHSDLNPLKTFPQLILHQTYVHLLHNLPPFAPTFQEAVQETAEPIVLCSPRPLSHRQSSVLLFHMPGGCACDVVAPHS